MTTALDPEAATGGPPLDHEQVVIRSGARSRLPGRYPRLARRPHRRPAALSKHDRESRHRRTGCAGRSALGGAGLRSRRVTAIGLGHVGELIARRLADAGADLAVTDIEPDRRDIAGELGTRWLDPSTALTTDTDVLVPAALGGQLSDHIVPRLRCAAIAGPANNQLAHPGIAEQLHARGILWAPDDLGSAGGIVYATAVEIDHDSHERARRRVQGLAATLAGVLTSARRARTSPSTPRVSSSRPEPARDRVSTALRNSAWRWRSCSSPSSSGS